MMQLFLNGSAVDVFGNDAIVGSYAVNDIGSIETRNGVYTNTFRLPLTNNNRAIFESAEVVVSGTKKPYRRLPARIDVNGTPVVIGWAIIKSASRHEYELMVVGGNADWFQVIGDKNLQDLDLDAYNHNFTATEVRASRANNTNWTDVYIYPNVEYGRTFRPGLPNPEWWNWRPGVYGKYLIWKIFREAGYEPSGDWWDNDKLLFDPAGCVDTAGVGGSDDFWAFFVPFAAEFKRDRNYDLRNTGKADTPVYAADPSLPFSPLNYFEFNNIISFPTNGWQFIHPTEKVPTILDGGTHTITLEATVTNVGPLTFGISLWYYDSTGNWANTQIITTGVFTGTVTVSGTATITCSAGFIYVVQTSGGTVSAMEIELIDYQPDELSDDELLIDQFLPFVTLASTLPDVSQADFLKAVFNKWGLIFNSDQQTGYVNIFRFDDLIGNISDAYDWSDKLDLTEEPVVSFVVGNYGKRSTFKSVNDENDKYIKDFTTYNEASLTVDDENLPEEVEVYESPFAELRRQSDSFTGTIRLGYIPKFEPIDDTVPNDPNDNDLFDTLDCAPKLCLLRFEPFHLLTMEGLPIETPVQPALHGLEFTWGKMLERYYGSLSAMINYGKRVKCLIRLNPADIHTLDFARPVWIEFFKSYFYINKIDQFTFTDNGSTNVELIKIGYDYEGGLGFDFKQTEGALLQENGFVILQETGVDNIQTEV